MKLNEQEMQQASNLEMLSTHPFFLFIYFIHTISNFAHTLYLIFLISHYINFTLNTTTLIL